MGACEDAAEAPEAARHSLWQPRTGQRRSSLSSSGATVLPLPLFPLSMLQLLGLGYRTSVATVTTRTSAASSDSTSHWPWRLQSQVLGCVAGRAGVVVQNRSRLEAAVDMRDGEHRTKKFHGDWHRGP